MPAIWTCTAGAMTVDRDDLPLALDMRLRRHVEQVILEVPEMERREHDFFMFTGWGKRHLDEPHLAVVEDRKVPEDHQLAWTHARQLIEEQVGIIEDMDKDDRARDAVEALTELLWWRLYRVESEEDDE